MRHLYGKISMEMRVFALIACLLLIPIRMSYASSLDDVANGKESSQTNTESGDIGNLFTTTDSNVVDGLVDNGDVSKEVQSVSAFREYVGGITAMVTQIIFIILTGGLIIISGIDLLYIVIPPLRNGLSGGRQGMAIAQQGAQQGMGGMNSGFGMQGGMNSGFGMNSGYGMQGGMGGMNSGMGMNGNQQMNGGKCYVTEAALNAVATAQADNSGKVGVAIKIWFKNAVVQLVAIPAIIVLLSTGVIQKIGFGLGGVIANALSNVHF